MLYRCQFHKSLGRKVELVPQPLVTREEAEEGNTKKNFYPAAFTMMMMQEKNLKIVLRQTVLKAVVNARMNSPVSFLKVAQINATECNEMMNKLVHYLFIFL